MDYVDDYKDDTCVYVSRKAPSLRAMPAAIAFCRVCGGGVGGSTGGVKSHTC